jgi:uncharacterized protein (DUF362 family)
VKSSASSKPSLSRRQFIAAAAAASTAVASGWWIKRSLRQQDEETNAKSKRRFAAETFIHRVANYEGDLRAPLLAGFAGLGVSKAEIQGKKILLKPNLVEPHAGLSHINTHPLLIRAAVEAFLSLGAAQVAVAEGPGHRTDTLLVLDESGLSKVLAEDHIRFIDLNYDSGLFVPNRTMLTKMPSLTFPRSISEFHWLVSMPKMKTHHWVGVTLSMKNLFGLMPGIFYGWPKNVFHLHGIEPSILDINSAVPPEFAIVDGIVGMEGDGPIMGDAKNAGVIVMGRNAPAVDATCARVMGIDPHKVRYLEYAPKLNLGPVAEEFIEQRGEPIAKVRTDFKLIDAIQAQQGLRLA